MPIDPKFIAISRKLRNDQTPWEKKLWMHLKGRKFLGLKFKRQVPIGTFIYDFSCFERKLIIELDGSQHFEDSVIIKDKEKEAFVEKLGYRTLRFNNSDLENNLEGVLELIRMAIA